MEILIGYALVAGLVMVAFTCLFVFAYVFSACLILVGYAAGKLLRRFVRS